MLILKRLLNFVFHGGEGDKKNLNGRGKGGVSQRRWKGFSSQEAGGISKDYEF